jgi:hypothetical protein
MGERGGEKIREVHQQRNGREPEQAEDEGDEQGSTLNSGCIFTAFLDTRRGRWTLNTGWIVHSSHHPGSMEWDRFDLGTEESLLRNSGKQ